MASKHEKTLAELRRERGISQRRLAKDLGLSHATIYQYESGLRVPSYQTARRIAEYFGVTSFEIYFPGTRGRNSA